MITRLLLLTVAVGVVALVVATLERRRGRVCPGSLRPGVTVVTGSSCTLCPPTLAALAERGITPAVYDVSRLPAGVGAVMSLPTVFVVDDRGEVVMRRSGRAALADADAVARLALAG